MVYNDAHNLLHLHKFYLDVKSLTRVVIHLHYLPSRSHCRMYNKRKKEKHGIEIIMELLRFRCCCYCSCAGVSVIQLPLSYEATVFPRISSCNLNAFSAVSWFIFSTLYLIWLGFLFSMAFFVLVRVFKFVFPFYFSPHTIYSIVVLS